MAVNPSILTTEIQNFIRSDRAYGILSAGVFSSPFNDVPPQELAVQIKGYRKALEKLPRLAAEPGIVYPAGVSMEQCSGETAALYKASIVPAGERCADITGGLGIDSLALSERFSQVDYYETDEELAGIAAHNFRILHADRIAVHPADGITAIAGSKEPYDLIYADPARRNANASRVFSVTDCTPDIGAVKDSLLEHSPRLLVKLSPMLDIAATLRLFPQTSQVHVVAVRGEVKELLFLLERGFSATAELFAADLYPGREDRVFSAPADEKPAVRIVAPARYIYDPSAALRKAGLADVYCTALGLGKLHPGTLLYTSDREEKNFQGRVFRTIDRADKKNIGTLLPENRASVVVRNYPAQAAQLAKKFKLKDSDRMFLLAFRDCHNRSLLLAAEREGF